MIDLSGVRKYLSGLFKILSEWLYSDEIPVDVGNKTLIWRVIDGPVYRQEFEDTYLYEAGISENYSCMLVVQIEEAGELGMANFWYETEEEAFAVKRYFDTNIEPLEVT